MANEKQVSKNKAERFQSVLARKHEKIKHDLEFDLRLIREYKEGNEEAGWELFESYADELSKIYRFPSKPPRKVEARRKGHYSPMTFEDKEDLFQEIACHFFKLVGEHDLERPFENMVRAKLHQRVFNQFYSDLIDKQVNETAFEEDSDFEQKATDLLLDSEAQESVPPEHLFLYKCLNELPKRQREVVVMYVVKGWSFAVIGEELGINRNAVKQSVKRGMDKLKLLMAEKGEAV